MAAFVMSRVAAPSPVGCKPDAREGMPWNAPSNARSCCSAATAPGSVRSSCVGPAAGLGLQLRGWRRVGGSGSGNGRHQRLRTPSGSRPFAVEVRASTNGDEGQQPAAATGFGLGGPGTWFGFGRNQERQVGRLAMVGFVAAVVMEVVTGKGIFGQLGLDPVVVRFPFLAGFTFLFIGGLVGGQAVINNPPDFSKAPPNDGAGIKRDPLKTFDSNYLDPLTTYTRGSGAPQGGEPYVSDLESPPAKEASKE